jgi:hypothetical protein
MGNVFGSRRINITDSEVRNDEEEGFSKTTPAHLVVGDLLHPDGTSNPPKRLGKFVRVMHERAGSDFLVLKFHCFQGPNEVLITAQYLAGETGGSVDSSRPIGLRTDGFYFQPDIIHNAQKIAVVSRLPASSDLKKVYFVVKQPTKVFTSDS